MSKEIDYFKFKDGVENLLGRKIDSKETLNLIGEPLYQLLLEKLEEEGGESVG